MPGLPASYGNVTRLEVEVPFFLRQDPFLAFRSAKESNYSWDPRTTLTLLVASKPPLTPGPRPKGT
jgi:hypothetical protein